VKATRNVKGGRTLKGGLVVLGVAMAVGAVDGSLTDPHLGTQRKGRNESVAGGFSFNEISLTHENHRTPGGVKHSGGGDEKGGGERG